MTRPESHAFPANPWSPSFLTAAVIAGVVAGVVVCAKQIPFSAVDAAIPLVSAVLAVLAWNRFRGSSAMAYGLLAASLAVAAFGLSRQANSPMEWLLLIAPFFLIVLYWTSLVKVRGAVLWIAPLLFGALFLDTAALLGKMSCGGFPAVLAVLLSFIVHATHELELRTPASDPEADPHVHIVHHRALAWISIVFFLFGVVSFWPWLGKMYGNAYFWVMTIGVLMPLLYLWGRLRQPRRQNSYHALLRFNRLIPYLGLILLVAIALG